VQCVTLWNPEIDDSINRIDYVETEKKNTPGRPSWAQRRGRCPWRHSWQGLPLAARARTGSLAA
jgi:hypothetical protein